MLKALLINPFEQEVKLIDLLSTKDNYFDLEECYKLLNCDLVEFVYSKDHKILIVDEEGLLKENNKPFKIEDIGQEYFVGKALLVNEEGLDKYSSITNEDYNILREKISFPTIDKIKEKFKGVIEW